MAETGGWAAAARKTVDAFGEVSDNWVHEWVKLTEGGRNMCDKGRCCQKPKELKGKPEDCTREQVKKCHGSKKDHSCAPKKRPK